MNANLSQTLPKTQREVYISKFIHKVSTTLIPKPGTRITLITNKKRKLQTNIPDEYRYKNPKQNTRKTNSTAL